jgi:DNA-binding CsgD family transcriptional regulator
LVPRNISQNKSDFESTGSPEELVRLLVRQTNEHADNPREAGVILDVEVDGVRCVLLRQHSEASADHSAVSLSPREREIARMVAEGYPNKAIAARLHISSWTVSTHLRRTFAKLGVRSRAAMVARVLEQGLML